MKTIYIVFGSEGSYDDYHEWDIKAFISKDKAEQFVELLKEEAKRVIEYNNTIGKKYPFPNNDGTLKDRKEKLSEYQRINELRRSEITENKYDSMTFEDNPEYNIKELELDETLPVEIVE